MENQLHVAVTTNHYNALCDAQRLSIEDGQEHLLQVRTSLSNAIWQEIVCK